MFLVWLTTLSWQDSTWKTVPWYYMLKGSHNSKHTSAYLGEKSILEHSSGVKLFSITIALKLHSLTSNPATVNEANTSNIHSPSNKYIFVSILNHALSYFYTMFIKNVL